MDVGIHIIAAELPRQRAAKGRFAGGACADEINRMSHQCILGKGERSANRLENIDERFPAGNLRGRHPGNFVFWRGNGRGGAGRVPKARFGEYMEIAGIRAGMADCTGYIFP